MNEEVDSQLGLCEEEHILLRRVALDSIVHGLNKGTPLPVDVGRYPPVLRRPGASFVTLQEFGELRGCIGSLEAHRPLVEDIAENAHAAAFRDPRFQPLQREELKDLDIHISVLTPAEPMDFNSEQDLLRQLQPGIDGLILEDRGQRGTFLPSVWESLPKPEDFLAHLKRKAGLPADYWSNTVRVWRYTCEVF
jgi:AmmeMemoRadiSam system protein A